MIYIKKLFPSECAQIAVIPYTVEKFFKFPATKGDLDVYLEFTNKKDNAVYSGHLVWNVNQNTPFITKGIASSFVKNNYQDGALLLFEDTEDPSRFSFDLIEITNPNYNFYCDLLDKFSQKNKKTHLVIDCDSVDVSEYSSSLPLQQIYYGAPGTGKSDAIKRLTAEGGLFTKDFTFRTTFHHDSDYSTFVGAYKPIWSDEKDKIVYEFRPQAFLKAYVAAWTHPDKQVALVVEEINRGNCAQIFGDIFQLLDREANGLSKYPIEADIDMQKFLSDALNGKIKEDWAGNLIVVDTAGINACYSNHYDDAFAKISEGKILTLPQNLSILATMNTSDQSLFPMDSAFKRRWDWIYQPIVEGVNKETGNRLGWQIKIDGYKPIDWWAFIERINYVVSDLTKSEDKQLGYFFCMPDKDGETTISAKRFVEKVIFYLWNDVFKDYSYDPECCNTSDNKGKLLYADFYNKENDTINADVIAHFINQLKTKDGINDPLAKIIDEGGDNNQQNDNAVVEEEADNIPDEPQQQSLFQ